MTTAGRLSKLEDLKRSFEVSKGEVTIGIDLGDRYSQCCILGDCGELLTEGKLRTTPEAFQRHFQGLPPTRIAIEVGAHSR